MRRLARRWTGVAPDISWIAVRFAAPRLRSARKESFLRRYASVVLANVGRLSCGEPPNACGAMAARLPRLRSTNATRSASGMTSRVLGAKRGFSPGSGERAADSFWQQLGR